jgi:hypothetical protein
MERAVLESRPAARMTMMLARTDETTFRKKDIDHRRLVDMQDPTRSRTGSGCEIE